MSSYTLFKATCLGIPGAIRWHAACMRLACGSPHLNCLTLTPPETSFFFPPLFFTSLFFETSFFYLFFSQLLCAGMRLPTLLPPPSIHTAPATPYYALDVPAPTQVLSLLALQVQSSVFLRYYGNNGLLLRSSVYLRLRSSVYLLY
jgi:hypothetical protein